MTEVIVNYLPLALSITKIWITFIYLFICGQEVLYGHAHHRICVEDRGQLARVGSPFYYMDQETKLKLLPLPNEPSYQLSAFLWDGLFLNLELSIWFQLDWLAIKPPGSTCLCPLLPSAGVTDVHWYPDVGDSNLRPHTFTTNILFTELSPWSPCNYILMFTIWNLRWKFKCPTEYRTRASYSES